MDVYKMLSEFYSEEYNQVEIDDMIVTGNIHKTLKFLTITWDDTEVMDIFKIVGGRLVYLGNTFYMNEQELEIIADRQI